MAKKSHPKVSLVGRTNVGKSTLFNRINSGNKSIVYDREGVTRDYKQDIVEWDGKTFELVDTGGFPSHKSTDPMDKLVRKNVIDMIEQSAVILFVCDVKNGLTLQDKEIARYLHRTGLPLYLILNKADNHRAYEENVHEFVALGIDEKNIIAISATHGTGIAEVLEKIVETIDSASQLVSDPQFRVAFLGRPNVGKSSLMNLLLKEDRSIVSDIAGTTREDVVGRLSFHREAIELVDTPGVRRKAKIDDELEELMVKTSFRAVRNANVVVLMVDASEGRLADQELKLLFYAFEENRPLILVFNKIDLLDDVTKERLLYQLAQYEFILRKIPQLWISCLSQKNVGKLLKIISEVWTRATTVLDSVTLNDAVKLAWTAHKITNQKSELKITFIKQAKDSPTTFIVHVNKPRLFKDSHISYLENIVRRNFDFFGCPLKFVLRKQKSR